MAEETAPDTPEQLAEQRQDPPDTEFQRLHPLTPLLTGWQVVAGAIAILTAQNISELIDEFTLTRLLIALGILAGIVLLFVAGSFIRWRLTAYAVVPDGVFLRSRFITTTRRTAPRGRIDSVSIHRPLVPRLLGLAKVRVELVGGGDSHLDLTYLSSARAEEVRRRILQIAASSSDDADAESAPELPGTDPEEQEQASTADRIRGTLLDGVTTGTLLAQIPTQRLLHALMRDPFMWFVPILTVLVAIGPITAMVLDGFSMRALIPVLTAVIAGPKLILDRIEKGWGFTSRSTDAGLRARRGLFTTRSDNLSADRIQTATLRQPLLWRDPAWVQMDVATAGAEDGDENGAILPVGTGDELVRSIDHMLAPVGLPIPPEAWGAGGPGPEDVAADAAAETSAEDDVAMLTRMLRVPAAELPGIRPDHWLFPLGRRFTSVMLTPHAVLVRSGTLVKRIRIIPRDRIQTVEALEGPIDRRIGLLPLRVTTADDSEVLTLPTADALRLLPVLHNDAATRRRLAHREQWARPRRSGARATVEA